MLVGCARSWLSSRSRLAWSTSPALATHRFSAPPSRPAESKLLLPLLPCIAEHSSQRPCEVYPYARPFCFFRHQLTWTPSNSRELMRW